MDNLFLLLFLTSIIALIVGLIKPDIFIRFLKERATRKVTVMIFGIFALVFFILFGITTEPTTQTPQVAQENKISENIEADNQTVKIDDEQEKEQTTNKNEIIEKPKTQKEETISTEIATAPPKKEPAPETPAPTQKTNRENILTILKANASSKWGTDYEMVQYEYNNQVQVYDWVVAQTRYPDIMAKAKTKWNNDFEMVKYEYNNQAGAYEWIISQTEYPNIMTNAKQKWGDDYEMIKYEYNNQVEAYNNL
ncbi:hypothetical protein KAI52_01680 [Candidatus Parcubacteria bacterium]|nr:hypothetical protein [Candidatus Parcubacteria bacterium]